MPIKLPSFRARRDAYPPDLWTKCPSCEEMLFNKQIDKVQRVCPSCGHHFRLSAEARIAHLIDHGTFVERDAGLQSVDPLGFVAAHRCLPPPCDRPVSGTARSGRPDPRIRDTKLPGVCPVGFSPGIRVPGSSVARPLPSVTPA